LINPTVLLAVVSESADEILIKQQLLDIIINLNVMQIFGSAFLEIVECL
jgi:hypothetical protein